MPARDSLARAVRSAGDRETADQIKALRRPTAAAWLVNQLVREQPDGIDELLATGAVLRATQAAVLAGQGDGAKLQALTAGRREQIDALVTAAGELALSADRKSPPLDAVAATLVAATSDEAAAAAVRSGRLVKELSYSGFGITEDLADSVAPALRVVPRTAASPAARRDGTPPKAGPAAARATKPVPERDPAAGRRAAAKTAATEAVQEAQRGVHEALGTADDAQRAYDAVARELERAAADEQRLAAGLTNAQQLLAATKERHRAARAAARSAHADAERARTALVKAQQKLDHLR